MIRHLVIGASGLVGGHLLQAIREAGLEQVGTYFSVPAEGLYPLDVRNRDQVDEVLAATAPDVVYLSAAMANVDWCEVYPEQSAASNVEGVRNVVEACRVASARLVFFSSDYVFDGRSGPYNEEDVPTPLSTYGRQKLAAEQIVLEETPASLVIRTTIVYGWERQGKNFVVRLVESLRSGERVVVPRDQVGTPTYCRDLACAAVTLAGCPASGLVHLAGPDLIDRERFARVVAEVFALDPNLIEGVPTAALAQVAPRPLAAGLVSRRSLPMEGVTMRGCQEGLEAMARGGLEQ